MGTLLANFIAHLQVTGLSSPNLLLALIVKLAADWGGATVIVRVLGARPNLERAGPLFRFAALVGLVVTPVAAVIGAAGIVYDGGPPFVTSFVRWYLPEVVLTLLLAPALSVALDGLERSRTIPVAALGERLLALLAVMGGVALVTLHPMVAGVPLQISLVSVPLLIFVAYRFGVGVTAFATVMTFATLLVITLNGQGQFARAYDPGFSRYVAVVIYSGAIGIPLVLLAAILSELRASSERFQSFLDTVDTPIIAVDQDRRVVGFSAAAGALFSSTSNVQLTLGMDPLGPATWPAEVMARRGAGWQRALSGESDVAVLAPNAKTRVEMRYDPMRNAEGDVVGAVASATDLLRREREEQARVRAERLEAVGRLAGGVAHDVNNLMTIVLGQTFILRDAAQTVEGRRHAIEEIETTVDRTKRLTTQLLAFARAQVISPRVVSLAAQVDASMTLLRRVVEEHTVITVTHRGEPWNVRLDIGQFEQVILNLGANARDAMPEGGELRVTTDTTHVDADEAAALGITAGEYATLIVRDNGHGISDEVLRDVFEPFFSTKGTKGTGLGLATVQAVVRKLGGAVRATSAVDEGTEFTLWFPRTHETPEPVPQPAPAVAVATHSGRVVVCEDNDAIRRVVVRTLTTAGFSVFDAPTPADALRWIDGDGRDTQLLVSDVVMPEMSGVELLREARARIPGLRVVLMTGYADDILRDLDERDRPDALLPKPFYGAEMIAQVKSVLARP